MVLFYFTYQLKYEVLGIMATAVLEMDPGSYGF